MGNYEIVIESTRGRFHFDWRALVEGRDLLWLLIRRELSAKFRQTILGPLWFIAQPLLTGLVFVFVFSRISGLKSENIPPVLFYLAGISLWNYFSQSLTGVAESLNSNAHLMGKVHFPRLLMPLSIVAWRIFPLALQLGAMGLIHLWCFYSGEISVLPGSTILLLPFIVAQMALLSLGLGLLISALTVRYRDLHHVFSLAIQLWMFASPIIYPFSLVPKEYGWLAFANPMVPLMEASRHLLFRQPFHLTEAWFWSMGVTMILLLIGLVAFQKTERTFIDHI